MGVLDLLHACTQVGNLMVWLRTCSSVAGAVGFALLVLPERLLRKKRAGVVVPTFFAGAVVLGLLSMVFERLLPPMLHSDGTFANLACAVNGAAGMLFVAALVRVVSMHRASPGTERVFLSGYCLFQALADFLFFRSELWSAGWWWWHLLRDLAAVMLMVRAIQLYGRLQTELSEALEARDEFISLAAHELRTPIAALKLNAELMLRRIDRERPEMGVREVMERAPKFLARLDRLMLLVEELLDVSKSRAGKLALRPEPADLAVVVRRTVEELGPELTASGCAVECDLASGVCGRWDPLRISQVVSNLVTNAEKFAPGKRIRVELVRTNGAARLSVHDSGIGIAEEDRARIFDRFERAVSRRRYPGLGLGLYIAKQIVQAHGGTIWVESEPGSGSTFFVQLPCNSGT